MMLEHCPTDRLPPSAWWRYALCHDGPFDGEYKDIPSFAFCGQIVKWSAGCYEVCHWDEHLMIRHLVYRGETVD